MIFPYSQDKLPTISNTCQYQQTATAKRPSLSTVLTLDILCYFVVALLNERL